MGASSDTPPSPKTDATTREHRYDPLHQTRTLEQLQTRLLQRVSLNALDPTLQHALPQELTPTTEAPVHTPASTTPTREAHAPAQHSTASTTAHTPNAERTTPSSSTQRSPNATRTDAPPPHTDDSLSTPTNASSERVSASTPATDPPPPTGTTWASGTEIDGRYQLLQPLGAGAWGTIWKARQKGIDRFVAVKILKDRDETSMHKARSRFEREARLASRVRHPSAVRVLDFGHLHNQPYLVMEWLDGMSLQHFLRDCGPLPPELILDIGIGVAGALFAAHQEGVIHRDLKPSNIMLVETSSGLTPVVVDFGLARTFEPTEATVTHADMIVGTPAYMSPESIRGRPLTPASDIYSLGVTFLTMLLGDNPFRGENGSVTMTNHLLDRPVDSDLLTLLGCSQDFADTLLQMVAIAPEQRPTAQQLHHDFQRLLDHAVIHQDTPRTAGTLDSLEDHLHIQHPDATDAVPTHHPVDSQMPRDASASAPHPAPQALDKPHAHTPTTRNAPWPWIFATLVLLLLAALLVLFLRSDAPRPPAQTTASTQTQESTSAPSEAPLPTPSTPPTPEVAGPAPPPRTPQPKNANTPPSSTARDTSSAAAASTPPAERTEPTRATKEPVPSSSDTAAASNKTPSAASAPTKERTRSKERTRTTASSSKADAETGKDAPSKARASLVLTVSPPGEVFIDDTSHGLRSSLLLDDLSAGRHTIRIERDGDATERRVELQAGKRHVESF